MAKGEFDPRRGAAGQVIDYTDGEGKARKIRADGEGVFRPKDSTEVSILDGFDFPVARVTGEEKPKARSSRKATRSARVVDNGQEDTRGPGAPASEPGVTDAEDK
jgi:hypothetical protein